MSIRLGYVEAAWFRGFCAPQRLTFDAQATVIYGPNGSGKSSIIEAIEWAFFGALSRAVHATNRQEYTGQRHVQNPRLPSDGATYVEVGVEVAGQHHVVRRGLVDLNTTVLSVDKRTVPSVAEAFGVSLHEMRRPVLSRSEGRMLIDASPSGRWDRLAALLGVDVFARSRDALAQESNRLGKHLELARAEAAARELREFEALEHVADVVRRSPFSRRELHAALVAAAAAEGVAADTPAAAAEGLKRLAPSAQPPLPARQSMHLGAALEGAVQALEAVEPPPDATSDAARQNFLRAGLAFVSDADRTCPFCGEQSVDAQRRRELREELEGLGTAAETERVRTVAIGVLRQKTAALSRPVPEGFRDQCERAGGSDESIAKVMGALHAATEMSDAACMKLTALTDATTGADWETTHEAAVAALGAARRAQIELEQAEADLATSLPAEPGRDEVVDRRRVTLRRACEQADDLARAGGIRAVQERIDRLRDALRHAERRAVHSRIAFISNRVVELYERLNPDEGVKPTCLAVHDGERNEVRLRGETYGSELNPVTGFSDGHLHCLAIALAIPCRVEHNPDWDVLLVDDPLFGIDAGHAARVAELFAELVSVTGKQLVVTTYYAQFARDLEHLTDARRWEVSPYSQDGLKVEPKGDEIETLVRTAEVLKSGEAATRRDAGGKLRDAFELLTDRIGRPYGNKGHMKRGWRIEQRIERLEGLGVDAQLLKRLETVGDRVNKASHAEEMDPTPDDIGWCCEHVRDLAAHVSPKEH